VGLTQVFPSKANATHNRAATNKFTITNRLIRRSGSWVRSPAIEWEVRDSERFKRWEMDQ